MINEHKLTNNVVIVFFRISLGFCFCFSLLFFQWFPLVLCLKWTFARLSNYISSVQCTSLNLLRVHFKGNYLFLEVLTTYLQNRPENVYHVFRVFYCCDRKYAKSQFWWKRFLIQKDDKGRSIYHVIVALCIRETHIMAIKPLKKMSCTHAFQHERFFLYCQTNYTTHDLVYRNKYYETLILFSLTS